jgi:Circularly permutated YpsA SLOG family
VKIMSGGQTGVDTAALEFAIETGIAHGGWVPKGRTNESGYISGRFCGLVEAADKRPITRTRLNIMSSDATLVITDGSPSTGTDATIRLAKLLEKPITIADLCAGIAEEAIATRRWLTRVNPAVLNIAGPRESEAPGIGKEAMQFLKRVFGDWRPIG